MKISLPAARRVLLHTQLLDGLTKLPKGKEGVAQVIEKLGYIQVDTIAVIQRAHHHTLWTRQPDYDPEMLHELQAKDRRVFEYWGHAASYLPMSDYRYYLPQMRKYQTPQHPWVKAMHKKHGHIMKPILDRIRDEGPLGSKDFVPPPGRKRGTWWDWKPAKVALELLFWRGELMVTERRNFHRVYDLTKRVLPNGIDTSFPDNDELGQFLVCRALQAYGIARENEIRDHIHGIDKEIIAAALNTLLESGKVVEIKVAGIDKKYYALPEMVEKAAELRKNTPHLFLLSPFDNLIIQRERIKQLFGFGYALECYVPAPKRKYGYFTLPILWGEQFVGRLEPKADRKKKTFIVRSLQLEKDFTPDEQFMSLLSQKLIDLMQFNECEKITITKTSPVIWKRELNRHLKKLL